MPTRRMRPETEPPTPKQRAGASDLDALVRLVAAARVARDAGVAVDRVSIDDGHAPGRELGRELAREQRRLVDAPPRAAVVRVWWAGLSDEVRADLASFAPLAVGNLDGVPWPARSAANHRTLADLIARRGTAPESAPAPGRAFAPPTRPAGAAAIPPRWLALATERIRMSPFAIPASAQSAANAAAGTAIATSNIAARAAARLATAITARAAAVVAAPRATARATRRTAREALLDERLDALASGPGLVDRGGLPRFLLAFDPARRAIVEYVGAAIADTDDPFASPLASGVEAVALFVPGNDSDLLQFEGKAHTLSELVHATAPGTTGLIVWQGGQFPSGPLGLGSAAAIRLGRRLGVFVNAIPRDPRARFVAFGFSFGGSVVGTALRLGMRVDAVAHVASAGLGPGVRSLADYPASADVPHTSMLAPGDTAVAPLLGLDLPRGPRGVGHGADPTAASGITRLETGVERRAPDGAIASAADQAAGLASGILRGHATLLEHWGTTAKHAMRAALVGGEAELAARRTPLERLSERLGLPWSPLQRRDYAPRFTTLPGGPHTPNPRVASEEP